MVIPNFFLSTAPSGSSSGTVVTRAVINISSDSDPLHPTIPTTDQSLISSSGFSESFYSESADSSAGFMRKPQGRELKLDI